MDGLGLCIKKIPEDTPCAGTSSQPDPPLVKTLQVDLCRLCANVPDSPIEIYNAEGITPQLSEIINEYLPVKVSPEDELSLCCCSNCASTILSFHEFALSCVEAQKRLPVAISEEPKPIPIVIPPAEPDQQMATVDDEEGQLMDDDEFNEMNEDDESEEETKLLVPGTSDDTEMVVLPGEAVVKKELIKEEDCSEEPSEDPLQLNNYNHFDNLPPEIDLRGVKACRKIITTDGAVLYKCDICLIEMKDMNTVNIHYKQHFEAPFTCHICKQTLSRLYGLKRHIRRKHFVDVCRITIADSSSCYICDICGATFSKEGAFRKHYRPHINQKSADCEVCGKTFSSLSSLKKHKAAVHFAVKFPCDICGKEFTSRWSLTDHVNFHLNRRPYKCVACGKDYPTSSGLFAHVCSKNCKGLNSYSQQGIDQVEAMEYVCHICIITFSKREELAEHFSEHHKDESSSTKDKKNEIVMEDGVVKYKCDYCNQIFDYVRNMKSHRKKMHGNMQLKCDVCGEEFSCLRRLQWHQDQKHVKKKIPCDNCGKKYSSGPMMKAHKMKCQKKTS